MNWTNARDRLVRTAAWALAAGLLLASAADLAPARAQQQGQAVTTSPAPANSGEGSGSITTTTTFQLIFAARANGAGTGQARHGCTVENTATHEQYVYFQGPGMVVPTAANSSALQAVSFPLDPPAGSNKQGGSVYCATNTGTALQDAIWISGTQSDTYVAKQQ